MTQPDIFDDDAPWAERLPELRLLLEAYASVPRQERFTDTAERPSKAMRSYLRMATYYPGRAFRATAEILDMLKQGLDEPDVASHLASMPPIIPPTGRTREDCLRLTIPHLVAFTEGGEQAEPAVPETRWEWRERLPNLSTLLGYFHQDASDVHPGADGSGYPDYEAIIADYFATTWEYQAAAAVAEISELLQMHLPEDRLTEAMTALGAGLLPPPGLSREGWLSEMATYLTRRLTEADYQRPEGPNPAYPPHDKRAFTQ
ncbi:MAG: hypothetical protein JO362_06220 [Streptomycetaceae bacterium]|nr:hypothetical protein [Streptomycetaceae bacterium]